MAEKKSEDKVILEREYIIPLRRDFLKVPRYKRGKRAISFIRRFLAKHMKVEDRNERKVRIDMYINEEIRFRGIRSPPTKIKVRAKKFESGIVRVELAEIPQFVKYKMDRKKKLEEQEDKKNIEVKKIEPKTEEKVEEDKEKAEDRAEKKEAVKETGMEKQERLYKQQKHTQIKKKPQIHRMALKK